MGYNVLQSIIKQLQEKGHPQEIAEMIGTKRMQNLGYVEKGTMRMTDLGKERSDVSWNTRKIQAVAKSKGLPEYYFKVNMKGNVVRNDLFRR